MATYDDGIPEDWYPGYYLDPRNAWKWMPAAFPGWLPSALVRTPPAMPPERWLASSSAPGLLDGLAALARPKSIEEQLAELRKLSLIPDSLGGEAQCATVRAVGNDEGAAVRARSAGFARPLRPMGRVGL